MGVDDKHGTVWVTNTRQNTVGVYSTKDLSVLKQWTGTDSANGLVQHSRDVIADPVHDLIFVSSASEGSTGDGYISVFEAADNDRDGTPYEKIRDIAVYPRTTFSPMSLEIDTADNKLYSVGLFQDKAIEIDTATLKDRLISLPGLDIGGRGASGVAYDPETNRLFVASQNNDELLIADAKTGATIKTVPTGTGALNVAFDPVRRLVYVANFGGTTVTVTDVDGNKVGNLVIPKANHLHEDGKGSVFVVNKLALNKVYKITPTISGQGGAFASAVPAITGSPKVAKTLAVSTKGWAPGTTFTYQWLADGAAIPGATKSSLKLGGAQRGKVITVKVTGNKPGSESVTRLSATTAKISA